jgi:thiol-disulfide isomerase/thioredoxin
MHWAAGFRRCYLSNVIGPPPVMSVVRWLCTTFSRVACLLEHMKQYSSLIALVCLISAMLTFLTSYGAEEADIPIVIQPAPSAAEQMKALRKEVDDAETAYLQASGDKRETLWKAYCQINDANLLKIFNLARQEPASGTAFEMFEWIVRNRRIEIRSLYYTNGIQSVEFLRDYHTANTNIGKICSKFGWGWPRACQPVMEFLRIAADKNPSRESRGQAALALACINKTCADIQVVLSDNSLTGNKGWSEGNKAEFLREVRNQSAEALWLESEKLLQVVLAGYSDCPTCAPTNSHRAKLTLGEVASRKLYDLQHLSVGKVAPEIEGEDLDGNKLKLRDYRGRVVVLCFWASWCGPCMQMVPSELKLAERMKGKPFALVGVNGDAIKSDAQRAVEKENISWASFWSKEGSDGPIPTKWNVQGWPTVFVLDPKGIIRFKGQDMNLVNQKVDQLVVQFADKNHY